MEQPPAVRLRRCYVRRGGMCLRLIVRGAAVPNATFPVKLLNARRRRFGAQGDALTAATMTAAAATAGIGDVCYADFLDAVRDVLGNAP